MIRPVLIWAVPAIAIALTGSTVAAPGVQVAQMVTEALDDDAGSIVTLAPAPVERYWLTATRGADGLVIDGYVPDAETRDGLVAAADTEADSLELAGGAPAGFAQALDFGLAALDRLDQGRFSLHSSVLTLTGTAASPEDYEAVRDLLDTGVPEGFVLAMNTIVPPPAPSGAGAAEAEAEASELADWQIDAETPEQTELAVASPYVWSASKTADGAITLAGHLPADPLRRVLMVRAGEAADTTQLAAGAPEGFGLDALAALDALNLLAEGAVTYDGAQWSIEGTPAPDSDRQAIVAVLDAAATAPENWSLALAETPSEPAPAEEPAPSEASAIAAQVEAEILAPAEEAVTQQPDLRALCEQHLAEFSDRNAILFQSGSARISEESRAALVQLADFITTCPQAPIYIEGHTDADGEETANLALSVSRAEAVAAALAGLGVSPFRLYAVGYGESAPIAPNDTAAGKRLNRRIVVSLDGVE